MGADFYQEVEGITRKDPRYKADAYEFVMQALWFTQKKLKQQADVSGRELLEGIRDFALDQYGPMARAVLEHWGIKATADFGEVVFNMVDAGLMGKTDRDSRDDFKSVYDFDRAFDVFKMRSR
jgi:uncharacterized repeat protein (TIGR04138 family)